MWKQGSLDDDDNNDNDDNDYNENENVTIEGAAAGSCPVVGGWHALVILFHTNIVNITINTIITIITISVIIIAIIYSIISNRIISLICHHKSFVNMLRHKLP